MDSVVVTYILYLAISIGLTVWVARTLTQNGLRFLVDVFKGDTALADSVNHLLVVGFYLINFGYVALALRVSSDIITMRDSVEVLSQKVGLVLLVLGVMHFLNLLGFTFIRYLGTNGKQARSGRPA